MDNASQMAGEIRHQYVNENYEDVLELASGEEDKTMLARRVSDGRLVIKKSMPLAQGKVYEKLLNKPHPNVVPVWDVIKLKETVCGNHRICERDYPSGAAEAERDAA